MGRQRHHCLWRYWTCNIYTTYLYATAVALPFKTAISSLHPCLSLTHTLTNCFGYLLWFEEWADLGRLALVD